MKRKSVFAILLLLCLLSGCACRHEFQEADCTNPQQCAKCQEVQGQALGHDWTAADCTKAETCVRCGESRGEPLAHSFSEWTFAEADMRRSCNACGFSEIRELDRAVYLETLLTGCWDGAFLLRGDEAYSAYDFTAPLDMLFFEADHGVSGHINGEEVFGTWEYLEYLEEEGQEDYIFTLYTLDDFQWKLVFSRREEEDLLYLLYPNGDQVLLQNLQALAESIVAQGSWAAPGGAGMYQLTFQPDRTVTGYLGQNFQGTWQLMPTQESYGVRHSGLYIRYAIAGQEVTLMATVLPIESQDSSAVFTPGTIALRIQNAKYELQPMAPVEIQRRSETLSEGPDAILGTWSSVFWRDFFDGYNIDHHFPGYSFTFHEDNTFTAYVGEEITGTWEYADYSFSNDTVRKHNYYVQIDGQRSIYRMSFTDTEGQMPELIFSGSTSSPDELQYLFLGKLSQADMHFMSAMEGTWTSTHEENSADYGRTATLDYHFQLQPDGTFTGYNGEAVSGWWNLSHIFYNEDGNSTYRFELSCEGAVYRDDIVVSTDQGEITSVTYRQSVGEDTRYLSLHKFTQQELESWQAAPALPLGDWRSYSVLWDSTQEPEKTGEYRISLQEDGTFQAQLDAPIQGTWEFDFYEPGDGYYYRFVFPGQAERGYQYFFLPESQEFMTFSIRIGEKDDFYNMVR